MSKNNDLFGWLRIDDTPINYLVMHTLEDPQYYLCRAFDKSDAQSGTPFLDGACFEGYGNYDTGLSAEYGDELITLSTCSYHTTGWVLCGRGKENVRTAGTTEPA